MHTEGKGDAEQMKYGLQIGLKFNQDGSPKKYPGNTVIADVNPDNPAYPVIRGLRGILEEGELGRCYIFLPEDSYHVTIIRGLNDYVRDAAFWPAELPADLPMEQVDDYFVSRAGTVEVPEKIHMRFSHVRIDDHDVRICLEPWDPQEETRLRRYRDEVASRLGLWLPGHDTYTYHITLAYVRTIPEGDCRREQERRVSRMDACLKNQDGFFLSSPRIAFYDDMLRFESQRIPRV